MKIDTDPAREPLPLELLVPRQARRITVDDHARWQATGRPPHENDDDLVDLVTEAARRRSQREIHR